MYSLLFDEGWGAYFGELPREIRKRFKRRIGKYESFPTHTFRHAKHGVRYFIDEIGQYRVCFVSDEETKERTFYFIGDHKAYEKFLGMRK
ncbi:hypothetical protein JW721_06290 [Candidatus Micrarchaeota archaeon]|nr:hypothetical protein [Candidatus Micrarchaeota archaeon]